MSCGGATRLIRASTGRASIRQRSPWRSIPDSPRGDFGRAVCTSRYLVVLPGSGQAARRGTSFDLRDEIWRVLPASPLDKASEIRCVAMGRSIFALGAVDGHVVAASYDTVQRTWQSLPRPPVSVRDLRLAREPLVWTGSDVVVLVHGANGRGYFPKRFILATRRWTTLARSPVSLGRQVSLTWTGREIIMFGEATRTRAELLDGTAHTSGARLDMATGIWTMMTPPPGANYFEDDDDSRSGTQQIAWTGSAVLVWTGLLHPGSDDRVPVLAYSPEHDRWATLGIVRTTRCCGEYPEGAAVWTGHEMILYFYNGELALAPEHS